MLVLVQVSSKKHQSGRVEHALLSHPAPARAGDFRALAGSHT
jgi:hypothetical protein